MLKCPQCVTSYITKTRENFFCDSCGLEISGLIYELDSVPKKHSKPYCAIHHFNERMAAFTCTGPTIKLNNILNYIKKNQKDFEKSLKVTSDRWGPICFAKIFEEVSKKWMIDLNKKKFHERWIWIKDHLDFEKAPKPKPDLLSKIRERYKSLYAAFDFIKMKCKMKTKSYLKPRQNIININFLILNILNEEGFLAQFGKYFADVKGLITNYNGLFRHYALMIFVIRNVFDEKENWIKEPLTLEEIKNLKYYK